jgi:hypothetical protein
VPRDRFRSLPESVGIENPNHTVRVNEQFGGEECFSGSSSVPLPCQQQSQPSAVQAELPQRHADGDLDAGVRETNTGPKCPKHARQADRRASTVCMMPPTGRTCTSVKPDRVTASASCRQDQPAAAPQRPPHGRQASHEGILR